MIFINPKISKSFFSMTAFTSSQKGGNSQQIDGEFWNDAFSI